MSNTGRSHFPAADRNRRRAIAIAMVFLAGLIAGCSTSTIETRKQERTGAYQALSPEQKQLVDQGDVRVGMSQDAVYIAWGPPSQVLEQEDANGHVVTWVYEGQWMEETRYWTYRELSRDGSRFLDRHLESDYTPRQYIRAEIDFQDGKVVRWRTLPRPR